LGRTAHSGSVVYGFSGVMVRLIGYDLDERITPWSVKAELSFQPNPAVGLVIAALCWACRS
jgi:hypothetical protein